MNSSVQAQMLERVESSIEKFAFFRDRARTQADELAAEIANEAVHEFGKVRQKLLILIELDATTLD